MTTETRGIEEEQKKLVLERFKTLDPEAKILLGGGEAISVGELIKHIEAGDPFGRKIVQVQMKMLQVLAGSA